MKIIELENIVWKEGKYHVAKCFERGSFEFWRI